MSDFNSEYSQEQLNNGAQNAAARQPEPDAPQYGQSFAPQYPQPEPQYGAGQSAPDAHAREAAKPVASTHKLSLPARAGLWIVGCVAGATIIFACAIVWIWGLGYIGVLPDNSVVQEPQDNEFNQYDEFGDYFSGSDFEDYFNDFINGYNGENNNNNNNNSDGSTVQNGTPGIGVTVQQLELDFLVDNIYKGGMVVIDIRSDSSLANTDVKIGDLIVAAGGLPTETSEQLSAAIREVGIGGELELTIARYENGVASTFKVNATIFDIG